MKKKTVRVWDWIVIILLLIGLICGSILIYRWWDRNQKLERLQAQLEQKERENQQNYQEQKNYLELTANLAKSPNIRVFFTDLLRNYAEKFAENKVKFCLKIIYYNQITKPILKKP